MGEDNVPDTMEDNTICCVDQPKRPLRFDINDTRINIRKWLDYDNKVDDIERRVVGIDMCKDSGLIYVEWEEVR